MEENKRKDRNDRVDDPTTGDEDQLRSNTMNEVIREVHGDPDTDLGDVRAESRNTGGSGERGSGGAHDSDLTQGMSYTPNDTSGVRSGGTTDMDDQTSGGAGLNTGARRGLGSHLKPKTGLTGSDFDGQDRTS